MKETEQVSFLEPKKNEGRFSGKKDQKSISWINRRKELKTQLSQISTAKLQPPLESVNVLA